jgi:hypothetical protein
LAAARGGVATARSRFQAAVQAPADVAIFHRRRTYGR